MLKDFLFNFVIGLGVMAGFVGVVALSIWLLSTFMLWGMVMVAVLFIAVAALLVTIFQNTY